MTILYSLMAIFFLTHGAEMAHSVTLSLFIIKNVILKALFPMMVVMRLLSRTRGVLSLSKIIAKSRLWQRLELSDALLPTILAGLLTGFPTSATDIGRMTEKGIISEAEGRKALALSSLPSPAFIIMVAWDNMLDGALRYLFLIISAYLFASLFDSTKTDAEGKIMPLSLPRAISEGASAVVSISGNIIFFNALTAILSRLFPPLTFLFPTVLEMTSGVEGAGDNALLKALSVGWSGVSALTQVRSLSPFVSSLPYIVTRVLSALSLLLFEISPLFSILFLVIAVNIAKIYKKSQKTIVKKRIWLYNKT